MSASSLSVSREPQVGLLTILIHSHEFSELVILLSEQAPVARWSPLLSDPMLSRRLSHAAGDPTWQISTCRWSQHQLSSLSVKMTGPQSKCITQLYPNSKLRSNWRSFLELHLSSRKRIQEKR